jgi:cation:H+ antiporter
VVTLWLEFIACSLLILAAGSQLLRYGDQIAQLTGLGGTWIGVMLLATVTSLPELATGITSVTVARAPNLAVGDVLGSCVFNLAMIALLDVLQRPASVFERSTTSHQLGAAFSILLLALVAIALVGHRTAGLNLFPSGFVAPSLLLGYVVAVRTIYVRERAARAAVSGGPRRGAGELPRAVMGYLLAACIVVAAAIALPFIAGRLAAAMGWTDSFVGTTLVAMTTSLPEMAVTVAAVRRGAVDLAIGNLVGSNLFNVVVLAVDSWLYAPGPLFDVVSPSHQVSALIAMAMSAMVIVALIAPPRARVLNAMSGTSVLLVGLYFGNVWVQLRHPG